MRFHRNTIWLVPLFLFVTFPLWSGPVGDFLKPRGNFDSPEVFNRHGRNFSMETIKIFQNKNGQRTAVIRARSARTTENPNIFEMEQVDGDIFDGDGNMTRVVAKTGTYDTEREILTLRQDVVLNKVADKQFLYTNLLIYSSSKRTINCPGKTRLEGPDVVIDGGALDYDITTQTYDISKRVHCTISGFVSPP